MNWKRIIFGAAGLLLVAGFFWQLPAVDVDLNIPPDQSVDYSKLKAWPLADLYGMRHEYGAPLDGDTLYWGYSDGLGTFDGHVIVSVNAAGDTLQLMNYRYDAAGAEDYNIFGPTFRTWNDSMKLWCLHDFKANVPIGTGAALRGGKMLAQDEGAGVDFRLIDTMDVCIENDVVVVRDEWEHIRGDGGDSLRLIIARTLTARKGDPYFLVHFEMSCGDSINNADTLRLIWSDEPGVGFAGNPNHADASYPSLYDVAHIPGKGLVKRWCEIESEELSAMAGGLILGMLNIGNSKVAGDTLSTGGSAVLNDTLKYDFGSGTESYVGAFVAFNHNCDVYPTQFVVGDLAPSSYTGCAFDTARITVDTTEVVDAVGQRYIIGRTDQFVIHNLDRAPVYTYDRIYRYSGLDTTNHDGDTCHVLCAGVGADFTDTHIDITPWGGDTGGPQGDMVVDTIYANTGFRVALVDTTASVDNWLYHWFTWEVITTATDTLTHIPYEYPEVVTFEYAVGRVYIDDNGEIYYPHITFTDGTEIRPRQYRVR